MEYSVQLAKMAALGSAVGMLAAHWLPALDAALIGTVVFYLLLVRVS